MHIFSFFFLLSRQRFATVLPFNSCTANEGPRKMFSTVSISMSKLKSAPKCWFDFYNLNARLFSRSAIQFCFHLIFGIGCRDALLEIRFDNSVFYSRPVIRCQSQLVSRESLTLSQFAIEIDSRRMETNLSSIKYK